LYVPGETDTPVDDVYTWVVGLIRTWTGTAARSRVDACSVTLDAAVPL